MQMTNKVKQKTKMEMKNMENSKKMTPDAKAARNAYAKAWRAKNKEKARAAYNRYWERKAAELAKEEAENDGSIDDPADSGTS